MRGWTRGSARQSHETIRHPNNQTNIMKKKLIIACVVAAVTATTAYAWTQCLSCKGTGWNGNLKCYPCGGDGKIGN